jgi:D-3-phosphoglycerate dehydrogenase
VIARHGVGVDNVAVDVAARRGIPVLITPQANLRSVAEHVFALALAVSRNLILADHTVRDGRFASRDRLMGRELSGATLGVIGLGRIGGEVARMAAWGFGMRVLGYDPWLSPGRIRERDAEPVETLPDLLRACDLVTVHVPLSGQTRGLLGRRELASMRPGSILIQTSRGGVVDEDALVEALRSGHLAGAGIDVYETEPPPQDHPFFSMEQIVLTPHTAALTEQAMRRMAVDAAKGILDVLGGADPYDPPDDARWLAFGPAAEPEE